MDVVREKEEIRQRIWRMMEERGISRFPKPVFGRIPNFEGSERAAEKLVGLPEFLKAHVVKVNPDSPQIPVRRIVLSQGKLLIMPSPRLRKGFLILDPKTMVKRAIGRAATISGALKYRKILSLDGLPKVDLIVCGSVAVSMDGARIGKGGGYSEIEYGILRELDLVKEETHIFTTVHDIQVVEGIPREEHDFSIDTIITPTRIIKIEKHSQPRGIIWEKITPHLPEDIPILAELKKKTLEHAPGQVRGLKA